MNYDAIVLGLGGMGTAAALHLARRGARVVGLEARALGHDRGSSHGESRLIRRAYFESPAYVPLLDRAYELWGELEASSGESLLHRSGLVLVSDRGEASAADRARDVARAHRIVTEQLDAAAARARFPALRIDEGTSVLWEPGAGWLAVERCVAAHARAAEKAGATLRFETLVRSLQPRSDAVAVTLASGEVIEGKTLVVTAGPWAAGLLGAYGLPLAVHRVVMSWYGAPERFDEVAGMPCFAFDTNVGFFYGFPRQNGEIKVAEHAARGTPVDPDTVERAIFGEDTARTSAFAARSLQGVEAAPRRSKVCLYTMTPDEHFIVDRHDRVVFGVGFSGHGFKFAPAIGELLATLALDGRTPANAEFLRRRDR